MNNKNLKYYKNIEKNYDFDKLNPKSIELFEMVHKYQFYGKRAQTLYLKLVYKIGQIITLHLAKKESAGALKNKKQAFL